MRLSVLSSGRLPEKECHDDEESVLYFALIEGMAFGVCLGCSRLGMVG